MIPTLILTGALSFIPPDLAQTVAANRLTGQAAPILTHSPADYGCLLGVPVNHDDLIDQEAYFLADDSRFYGPWLIVDVQHPQAPDMRENGLLADVSCADMVHRRGQLVIFWD